MIQSRNYGIDFLRFVFMFMVCLLHVIGQGGVLSVCAAGETRYAVYWLIETFSYCAVDGFAFITGYMATDKPQKISRLIQMWFQAWFYAFVLSIILTVFGFDGSWDWSVLIQRFFPVTFNQFWYFTAYFALFMAMPVLNAFIFRVSVDTAKRAFITLFFMFSFLSVFADPFQLEYGYSALWIIVVYLMGGLAKRIRLFETKKSAYLVLAWLIINLVTWALLVFFHVLRWTSYLSPTILLSAILLVVLFSRIQFKGTLISKLSPLVFGVYLFQLNPVIWNEVLSCAFTFIAEESIIQGSLQIFLYAAVLFLAGLFVEMVRVFLEKQFKIDILSQKLEKFLRYIVDRVFRLSA